MSIKTRAIHGDRQALESMFRQFIPNDEVIEDVAYLGQKGVLGFGTHSFAAVTDRRVASLKIAALGEVAYSDGYHEQINSSVVYQPSRLRELLIAGAAVGGWLVCLFLFVNHRSRPNGRLASDPKVPELGFSEPLLLLGIVAWLAIGFAVAPAMARLIYRASKSGLVLVVRGGVKVYCFADRRRLGYANRLASVATIARERRIPHTSPAARDELYAAYATEQDHPVAPIAAAVLGPPDRRQLPWSSQTHAWAFGLLFSTVVLVRCVAIPTNISSKSDTWTPTLLLLLVPSLIAYAAGITLALSRTPTARALGLGLMLGTGLGIGLQSLAGIGYADVNATHVGFRVGQAAGVLLAVVAIVGWITANVDDLRVEVARATGLWAHVDAAAIWWTAIGGAAVFAGSLMPWYRTREDHFWGLIASDTNSMYLSMFVVGTIVSLGVPVIALGLRQRVVAAGLLGGWIMVVAAQAITIEIQQSGQRLGFRLLEVGSGLALLGSLAAVFRPAADRATLPVTEPDGAWPAPSVTVGID